MLELAPSPRERSVVGSPLEPAPIPMPPRSAGGSPEGSAEAEIASNTIAKRDIRILLKACVSGASLNAAQAERENVHAGRIGAARGNGESYMKLIGLLPAHDSLGSRGRDGTARRREISKHNKNTGTHLKRMAWIGEAPSHSSRKAASQYVRLDYLHYCYRNL